MARASSPPTATLLRGKQRRTRVRREQERDVVARVGGPDVDTHLGLGHRQLHQLSLDRGRQLRCRDAPRATATTSASVSAPGSTAAARSASIRPALRPRSPRARRGVPAPARQYAITSVSVSPYLRPEVVQQLAPLPYRGEAVGIVLDSLTRPPADPRPRRRAQPRSSAAALRRSRTGAVLNCGERGSDRVDRATLVVKRRPGQGCRFTVRERVGELVFLDREPRVLVRFAQCGALELVHLEPQQVDLACPCPLVSAQLDKCGIAPGNFSRRGPQRFEVDGAIPGRARRVASTGASNDCCACWP